jgi:hypothetical protein
VHDHERDLLAVMRDRRVRDERDLEEILGKDRTLRGGGRPGDGAREDRAGEEQRREGAVHQSSFANQSLIRWRRSTRCTGSPVRLRSWFSRGTWT